MGNMGIGSGSDRPAVPLEEGSEMAFLAAPTGALIAVTERPRRRIKAHPIHFILLYLTAKKKSTYSVPALSNVGNDTLMAASSTTSTGKLEVRRQGLTKLYSPLDDTLTVAVFVSLFSRLRLPLAVYTLF